jgi:hypothetical protein
MSSLLSNGMFINSDFGTTRQSFWAQNDRIAAGLAVRQRRELISFSKRKIRMTST